MIRRDLGKPIFPPILKSPIFQHQVVFPEQLKGWITLAEASSPLELAEPLIHVELVAGEMLMF